LRRGNVSKRIRKNRPRDPNKKKAGKVTGKAKTRRDVKQRDIGFIFQNTIKSNNSAREIVSLAHDVYGYAESIVDTVHNPLIVLDGDLRVISANRSFYQTFQVTPEETEGQLIYDLGNHQWDIPSLHTLLDEIILHNTVFQDYEVEHTFPTIGQKTMLLNARRVRRESDNVRMVLLAIDDITERRQAERARDKLENELQIAKRLSVIGETAALVGHDLRNPLQAMVNNISLLRKRSRTMPSIPLELGLEEFLAVLGGLVMYMDKIVSDLQDYTRPVRPKLVETNLRGLIEDTLSAMRIPRTVEVSVTVRKDSLLKLDPGLMKRVFNNLFLNAVQAMPEGGKLTISSTRMEEAMSIRVQDTGVGIPKKNIDQIFNPLFTTKAKGVGFGLLVCKRLVEVHNGAILVESEVGEGSTFTVKIPFRPEVSE
jgi:two-component system CheB/CheR fusion protein